MFQVTQLLAENSILIEFKAGANYVSMQVRLPPAGALALARRLDEARKEGWAMKPEYPMAGFLRYWGKLVVAQPWIGDFFVSDDGPRCSGAASPDAIEHGCIDENEEHAWKRTLIDWEYAEYAVVCTKCGKEAP